MYDWQDFKIVFQPKPDFKPDAKHAEAILKHREELGGTLFFDRIWHSLGLKQAAKNYPPKTNAELRSLWSKIVQAQVGDEQKLALLYYLVRDVRTGSLDASFVRQTHLPAKYRLMVSGLWELDHCQFSRALEHLTDPSLTPTFADDILFVLLQHPKCDNALAMAYYITVRPPLRNEQTLDAYFALLVKTNVTEAYRFAKQNPNHQRLFEQLVVSVHGEDASEARAQRALQFLGLPFTGEEEAWFEECLLKGRAAKAPGAKDSVLMRRLATGKLHAGSSAVDRLKGSKIDGVDWEDIRQIMAG